MKIPEAGWAGPNFSGPCTPLVGLTLKSKELHVPNAESFVLIICYMK
jgi:hypothetical protein